MLHLLSFHQHHPIPTFHNVIVVILLIIIIITFLSLQLVWDPELARIAQVKNGNINKKYNQVFLHA